MPAPKVGFPMVIWKQKNTLFCVGGFNVLRKRKVEEYSVLKNKWRSNSKLPQALSYSSAVILHSLIYNIGGGGSSNLFLFCDLSSTRKFKCNALDLRSIFNLDGF